MIEDSFELKNDVTGYASSFQLFCTPDVLKKQHVVSVTSQMFSGFPS